MRPKKCKYLLYLNNNFHEIEKPLEGESCSAAGLSCRAPWEDAVAGLAGRTSNNRALGKHTLKYSPRLPKAVFNLAYRTRTHSGFHRGPEEPSGAAGQRECSARPSGPAVCERGVSLLSVPSRRAWMVTFLLPAQKYFQLHLSQEFCSGISFLPSASFPEWPASLSLRGGESSLRRSLPCLLY